jgi:hypothetical protein
LDYVFKEGHFDFCGPFTNFLIFKIPFWGAGYYEQKQVKWILIVLGILIVILIVGKLIAGNGDEG